MTRRGLLGVLASLAGAVLLCWCAGLAWFAVTAAEPPGHVPRADGIVVLTGGARRLDAALSLLEQHRAGALLVSGVSEQVSLPELLRAAGRILPAALSERISLGHAATTTVGNAMEAASWARANDLRSLIVVTAGYHMRRAMAEIATALPEATLYPYPVQPPAFRRNGPFLLRPSTLRLLATEYTKWLAVELGLTGSAHLRETA